MASNQSKRRRHRRSFGAIRQLKSGNFQASYKDLNGLIQRAPQTFATREAADQFIAVKQADLIAEREAQKSGRWFLDANRGAITLGEYLSRYMHAKQDWSERTRELNERLAARWIMEAVEGHCLADKRLDAISPFMVRGILQGLAHDNWVRLIATESTDKGGRPAELWELHPQAGNYLKSFYG